MTYFNQIKKYKNQIIQFMIFSLLPLIIGLFIYIIYRPEDLSIINRSLPFNYKNSYGFNLFIVFNLPDIMFAISLYSTLRLIDIKKAIFISIVFVSFFEIIQIFEYIAGTFDFIDLFGSIGGILLVSIILKGVKNEY